MISKHLARLLPLSSILAHRAPQRFHHLRPMSSTSEDAGFGGDISDIYTTMFEDNAPVWQEILETVQSVLPNGEGKIIDIATGPGEPATTLGAGLPNARIIATDLEQDMVDKAAERAAQLPNVECRAASAEELSDFSDGEFDVMTVCYGHMFFPDLDKALREASRVLKPGGHMLTVVWKSLGHFNVGKEVLQAVDPEKDIAFNPAWLSEEGLMEEKLSSVNFEVVKRLENGYPFSLPDLERGFVGFTLPFKSTMDEIFAEKPGARDVAFETFLSIVARDGFKTRDGGVVMGSDVNRYVMFLARKAS